jgi:hypothetical protein
MADAASAPNFVPDQCACSCAMSPSVFPRLEVRILVAGRCIGVASAAGFCSWNGGSGVAATRECVMWRPSRSSWRGAKWHGIR